MTTYRPRMTGYLTVPTAGKRAQKIALEGTADPGIQIPLKVRRSENERNDHNHADSCRVDVDWKNAGIDPRLIRNATLSFYLDEADTFGNWEPKERNCRFIGMVNECTRNLSSDDPHMMSISALDYTTLFLRAKPFGSSGIPDYSQTLDDAWRRIVSQTPGAGVLADRLVLRGLNSFPKLGDAVAKRFKKLGKVPVKQNTDAWAVWQQCVGMMALISFIDRDQCIVTTSTTYYTGEDPPKLIWGKNIKSMSETRDVVNFRKGILLSSFDPDTGSVLEARFPPKEDKRLARKQVMSHKIGEANPKTEIVKEWDPFPYPGVTNKAKLLEIAENAYHERKRQELQGTLTTYEMETRTEDDVRFDLVNLQAGENIKIAFNEDERAVLAGLPTEGERIRHLVRQGYSSEAAQVISQNMNDLALLNQQFYVKRVMTRMSTETEGGDFMIEISYANRILIGGDAVSTEPPTQRASTPGVVTFEEETISGGSP